MRTDHPLEARAREHLLALGLGTRRTRLLVAFSGGCDSVVLLHLLRFRLPDLELEIVAGHLDHNMRPGSRADAEWVRGICAAWEIPLVSARLDEPPRAEAEARGARYTFLRRCAAEQGAELIATAHHADDQAETVLFRAVRGTGLKGLAGIPPLSGDLVRPLLPFWRTELEDYAGARGLPWRTDPTNAALDPARNRVRHEILPLLERHVASSARRSLVSLAVLAGEAEEALERIASHAENELVRWDGGTPSLARDRLRLYDSAVASRVLRKLLRHFGVVPGRTGTRRALQFITDAPSGRQMPLSGALRIDIEFDRAVFRTRETHPEDRAHVIESPDRAGEASIRLGGVDYVVRYGSGGSDDPHGGEDLWTFGDDVSRLEFPLRIRGWRDGDRLKTRGGTRTLKRFFLEQRIPRERRRQLPLLVDAGGKVIWVAGLGAGAGLGSSGDESFILKVVHD